MVSTTYCHVTKYAQPKLFKNNGNTAPKKRRSGVEPLATDLTSSEFELQISRTDHIVVTNERTSQNSLKYFLTRITRHQFQFFGFDLPMIHLVFSLFFGTIYQTEIAY